MFEIVLGCVTAAGARAICELGGACGRPAPVPTSIVGIAVLVGGYGSGSGHASVLELDTTALGYEPADVAQFSYAGGRAPGDRDEVRQVELRGSPLARGHGAAIRRAEETPGAATLRGG